MILVIEVEIDVDPTLNDPWEFAEELLYIYEQDRKANPDMEAMHFVDARWAG